MTELIEYRVRPVTRYIITRHEESETTGSTVERGQYENADTAYEVAYALCKTEHEQKDWPFDDKRIRYPRHPNDPQIGGGPRAGYPQPIRMEMRQGAPSGVVSIDPNAA